uniref:Large ribosomal subunit protein uL24c n=1 Tax=Haraldiophyllum bonnemaisonii TaxID=167977 RepID=A0A4D6WWL5_9FLOR|nr:ribosomal protein L24 [Haraldiophyllum bonnemaisonii]
MQKKINIKIGDKVQIISGKYKNQIGNVKKVLIEKNSLIIENLNFKTKHIKPRQNEKQGEIKKIEAPIDRSNIKIQIN